ncbi:MAG: Asp-tRNA(Asn)/Glu-tRNA(Gln) amidotransferase subunit GatC [Bacteroidota bacterium]|nr:Asp-tRNA(Asn)/Glu-tRNA(Gln) amidotransferase subunit GatC [Bacteroidota bacterium]
MKITDETIDKLAHLARLEFNGVDKENIKKDLSQITAFCEKLNEIDTTGVEPLIYMSDETNVLREDIIIEEISHVEALKNAPKKDSDYFRVPKFLEK